MIYILSRRGRADVLIIIFFRLSHQATAGVIDHVLANVMPAAVEVTAGRSSPSPRGGGRYVHSNHRACTAPDSSLTRTITCSALFAIVLTSPRTRTRIRAHAHAHTHAHTHTRTRTRTRTRTPHTAHRTCQVCHDAAIAGWQLSNHAFV